MSTASSFQYPLPPVVAPGVPLLANGDRLQAPEFLRRYEAMPGVVNAELIGGRVFMPSPVADDDHGFPHLALDGWLALYMFQTPGVRGADNSTIYFDEDSVAQPDGLLRILPQHGGRCRVIDRYLSGGPNLVAEVSASSVSYDLHDKLETYERGGVQEYVVWRVLDRAIDWFVLRDGRYERLPLDTDGLYRSQALPGLWLDPAALIAGNFERVLAVAQQGLASAEHQAFVVRLQASQNADAS